MAQKLIFLDIDGTLTEPGSNVPPDSALVAIQAARAAGHKVFLCSGRNPAMLSPLLRYPFDGYIACAGGYVVCGGKTLYDCPMTPEQQEKALRELGDAGVLRTVETRDGSYCDSGFAEFLSAAAGGNSELLRWRKALEQELGIRPMAEYDGAPIYKVVFLCARPEQLEGARAALQAEFHFVIQDAADGPGVVNGELINRRFDKGSGVRTVAEALGIPIRDTIGFGDSMNDLEMIETVGTGVVMENGSPTLKTKADLVCPAVGADGLAKGFALLGLTGDAG